MIIQRDLFEQIRPFLKRKEFIAIIGARQSGKTTFLEIIKDYLVKEERVDKNLIHLITFEDRKLLAQFEREPVSFVRSYLPVQSRKLPILCLMSFSM